MSEQYIQIIGLRVIHKDIKTDEEIWATIISDTGSNGAGNSFSANYFTIKLDKPDSVGSEYVSISKDQLRIYVR